MHIIGPAFKAAFLLGTYDIEKIAFPLEIRFANPGEILPLSVATKKCHSMP